jgi:hypothetical protein
MGRNDEQFENYLREFELRRPRALASQRETAVTSWRRLAAAAGVMVALGTSLWLVMHAPERQEPNIATRDSAAPAPAKKTVRTPLALLPFTRLALTDPARLDAELSAASREVLPDFRSDASALRILAKE